MSLMKRYADRPRLEIPRSQFELTLEILGIGALVFQWAVVALVWKELPETVPIHLDASGNVNGWGAKGTVFVLPVIGVVVYSGLTILGRYPHIYNYLWPITPENAGRQYRIARIMLAVIKIEISLLFAYISWLIVNVARGIHSAPGLTLLPLTLVVITGTVALFLWRAHHDR